MGLDTHRGLSKPIEPAKKKPMIWVHPAVDTWKLREAAKWFDTLDELIDVIVVEDNQTHVRQKMVDLLDGPSREIQEYLLDLAERIEAVA